MTTARTRELELPQTAQLPWSARLARRKIFERIAALPRGRLVIEDAEGTWRFGSANAREELVAHVQVTDSAFYHELASGGSVGAAESWVRGHWKTPDLLKVMQLMAANIDLLNAIDDRSSALERVALRALHLLNRNSKAGSRRNIEAHYDLGNEMFALFLDPTMMYSAAIFPHREATLEEASLAKLDAHLPPPRAGAGRPPARDRHRLGRHGRLRGAPHRLPRDHHHDLARSSTTTPRGVSRPPGSPTG